MKKNFKSLMIWGTYGLFVLSFLFESSVFAQTQSVQPLPPSKPVHRMGFMIEGLFTKHVFSWTAYPDSNFASGLEPSGVPIGVVGFRFSRVSIGLGASLFRMAGFSETDGAKLKVQETGMVFTPRVEIIVFSGPLNYAEAYIAAGPAAGFFVSKIKLEGGGASGESKEKHLIFGAQAGMGGRYFFRGGPFSMGFEFGWDGVFIHDEDDVRGDATEDIWNNSSGFYVAITGSFVF